MRKLVVLHLSASTLALATTLASAADLPSRALPPVFVPPAPLFTWTGFYVGVNAGGAFPVTDEQRNTFVFRPNSIKNSEGTNGTLRLNRSRRDDVGFSGGGQVGYNYQFSPNSGFVVGVEADIQYLNLGGNDDKATKNYTFKPVGIAFGQAFLPPKASIAARKANNFDFFGTARGRLGYAFDRLLVYGTGGLAYTGDTGNNNKNNNNKNDNNIGFAAGGGFEYAFTNSFSVKIEGLYVNLGTDRKRADTATFNTAANVITLRPLERVNEFAVVRAGLNYRF